MSQFSTNFYGWHMQIMKWNPEHFGRCEQDVGVAKICINLLSVSYFHLKLIIISPWHFSRENACTSRGIKFCNTSPPLIQQRSRKIFTAGHWTKDIWRLNNLRKIFPVPFSPQQVPPEQWESLDALLLHDNTSSMGNHLI